ncbi:oligosaccharide flippase family protein [Lentilactobacillus parafarraginis]|uniref:oligosaccharide flippase family protein n=1 Tax=Lentilactobacillus parafarraginis TaxID=390842 RepID=UPI000A9687DE|nr:oligosaccharide flippase family protein [Lentilactobacillus parafarraginis]
MTNNSRRKQVLTGTFVLTASAFIAKLLSAVYRVPFQNMVGNVGFYVYQQIYPIYGIGMTFALNGLPMFISKLVVDVRDPADQIALIRRLQVFLSIISLIIFLGLQFARKPSRWP